VGEHPLRPDRLPGDALLLGAEGEEEAEFLSMKSIRKFAPPSRSSASPSRSRSASRALPSTRVFDSGSVATTFRTELAKVA